MKRKNKPLLMFSPKANNGQEASPPVLSLLYGILCLPETEAYKVNSPVSPERLCGLGHGKASY